MEALWWIAEYFLHCCWKIEIQWCQFWLLVVPRSVFRESISSSALSTRALILDRNPFSLSLPFEFISKKLHWWFWVCTFKNLLIQLVECAIIHRTVICYVWALKFCLFIWQRGVPYISGVSSVLILRLWTKCICIISMPGTRSCLLHPPARFLSLSVHENI